MRRRHLAGNLAILGPEYAAHVAGMDAAAAGIDHRPDDGPNHLVTERVGADLEAQQARPVVGRHLRPSRQHHIALHRRLTLAFYRLRSSTERREVVLTDQ